MKSWILLVVSLALVLQLLIAWAMPGTIMSMLLSKVGNTGMLNTMVARPVPDASMREVVRPSPDLAYSICVFDLSDGPLKVSSPVPSTYWSLQFYGDNTDNFGGFSNRGESAQLEQALFSATLVGPNVDPSQYSGAVIQSPSAKGLALIRQTLVGVSAEDLKTQQAQHYCGKI
jgi:uncharacterized membrane protein